MGDDRKAFRQSSQIEDPNWDDIMARDQLIQLLLTKHLEVLEQQRGLVKTMQSITSQIPSGAARKQVETRLKGVPEQIDRVKASLVAQFANLGYEVK